MNTLASLPTPTTPASPASSRSQLPAERGTTAQTLRAHRLLRVRRAAGMVGSALSVLVVGAIVCLALALTAVPWALGGHTLTVLSGSMRPLLPVGSVLVDRPTPIGQLRVGQVITYATHDPGSGRAVLVTHRIAAITTTATGPVFTTKGDANRTVDSRPVQASQIRGQLWFDVPYLGRIRSFLLNGAGLVMLGSALTLVLGITLLRRALRPTFSAPTSEPAAPPAHASDRPTADAGLAGTDQGTSPDE